MIIDNASNSIVTITGLSKPSDTAKDQKSWTTDTKESNLACYIEQANAQTTLIFAGEGGVNIYNIFVPGGTNIDSGDKITDNHGRSFTVQSVQKFVGDQDVQDHYEGILVQRYPNA